MIKAMKKKLTKDLKNLEHLEVQNNRITRISGLILQSASNLLYADFSHNKIETISSKCKFCSKIREIHETQLKINQKLTKI